MPNENCLDGMRCPKCKSEGPFRIVSICWVEVHDSGVEDSYEHEWEDLSPCICAEHGCLYSGKVEDFKEKKNEGDDKPSTPGHDGGSGERHREPEV